MHTHTKPPDNKQTSLKEINPFCEHAFSHVKKKMAECVFYLENDTQRHYQEDKSQAGLEL